MKVHIFIPCFVDQLYPTVGMNMVKVLEKAGCEVIYNSSQTCCGQPAFNAGFWGEAKEVCTKFITDFEGAQYIVTPSASCAGFVKNYFSRLFENSAYQQPAKKTSEKIHEFSSFLVNVLQVENLGATLVGKATYHDSCAALRECGIKEEPRKLLQHVQGLELIEMKETSTCCGFGGTFAVKFEPISIAMGEQKTQHAQETGAKWLISTDMSCLMHIDGCIKHNNAGLKIMHLADVLASGWE
ncbi:MAG: (Fe-S)-binding protein [Chitinophagia bacterium]|jgi:L-lactate dehydrogenase complex protein LldE|nr:(Fe-S)-binding protein [Chitinophagia bacterium]